MRMASAGCRDDAHPARIKGVYAHLRGLCSNRACKEVVVNWKTDRLAASGQARIGALDSPAVARQILSRHGQSARSQPRIHLRLAENRSPQSIEPKLQMPNF